MKNKLITISALILTLCAPVHAQTQQDALADASQMIAAEANVTRDTVAHMLRRMEDQSMQTVYNASDYRVKTAQFRQRVSVVLQAFEQQMQSSILPKLNYWANRYNSIYRSTTMSEEQKREVLAQQFGVFEGQVALVEQEYHQALRTAYQAVGDLPLTIDVNWVRNPSFRDRRQHGCRGPSAMRGHGYLTISYETPQSRRSVSSVACVDSHNNVPLPTRGESCGSGATMRVFRLVRYESYQALTRFIDESQVYQQIVYPVLQQGCRSQICLALSAADLTTYISLVRTSLDREISIILDGNDPRRPDSGNSISLKLRPLISELRWNSREGHVFNAHRPIIEGVNALQHLLSLASYPAEARALPFDTETE